MQRAPLRARCVRMNPLIKGGVPVSTTPTRGKRSHEVCIVSKRKVPLPPQLKRVNLNAAGIDIGLEEHWAAVPPGRDSEGRDVRSFGAFSGDLCALADWLKQCEIETVAMESTGVYWIALSHCWWSGASKCCLSMPARRKTSLAVRPTCSTASGCKSCIPTDCYAVRFAPLIRSVSYAAISANARCWWPM